MAIKDILIDLQEKVEASNPAWIEDYKKLLMTKPNTPTLVKEFIEILDDMADWEYPYSDVVAVFHYENSILNDFSTLEKRVAGYTAGAAHTKADLDNAETELNELKDAIEKCFVTVKDLKPYEDREDVIAGQIEDLRIGV